MFQDSGSESSFAIAKCLSVYTNQPVVYLLFTEKDVNFKEFALNIKDSSDFISARVKRTIGKQRIEALTNDQKSDSSKEIKKRILMELNRLLVNSQLVKAKYFKEQKNNLPLGATIWAKKGVANTRRMHLNRLLLEMRYKQLSKSPLFNIGDLKDVERFIFRLRNPKVLAVKTKEKEKKKKNVELKRGPLARHIWYQLTPKTQQLFNQYKKGTSQYTIKNIVVDELNKIVLGEPIYKKRLFKDIKLSKNILSSLGKKLTKRENIKLNRLLISAGFKKRAG